MAQDTPAAAPEIPSALKDDRSKIKNTSADLTKWDGEAQYLKDHSNFIHRLDGFDKAYKPSERDSVSKLPSILEGDAYAWYQNKLATMGPLQSKGFQTSHCGLDRC